MTNASSAMAAAGNTFDQTVALLTAANATVQNASKSSTALRTISARIRKTKTELDDLGESMTEATYDNLVSALTQHHVALTTISGEFRSTYDIMKDIAAQWDDMTSMEQAAIAEAIAGTRQQTVFYSIVENFKEASGAMDSMAESAGSLSESYGIYLNTTQAHIQQFHTAWQTLARDAVDSDTAKGFVDFGTSVLKVADSLQRLHILIPTIIAGFNAIKAARFALTMSQSQNSVRTLTEALMSQTVVTKSLEQEFMSLSAIERRTMLGQLNLAKAAGDANASLALQKLETAGLTTAEEAATVATDGLNVSIKGILSSNPLGWIMLAVSGILSVIQHIRSAREEVETTTETIGRVRDEMKQLSSDSKSVVDDYRSLKENADELIPRYVELAGGVDDFNHNLTLSDEEYREFLKINNEIADLLPELKVGIDSNGDAIINMAGNADALADSLWSAVDAQRELAKQEIADNFDEALGNAFEMMGAYETRKQEALDAFNAAVALSDEIQAEVDFINNYGKVYGNLSAEKYKEYYSAIVEFAPEVEALNDDILDTFDKLYYMSPEEAEKAFAKIKDSLDEVVKRTKIELDSTKNKLIDNGTLSYLSQTAVAKIQIQPEYEKSSKEIRSALDKIVSDIDFAQIIEDAGAKSEPEANAAVMSYLFDNVLEPVRLISGEVEDTLSSALNIKASFDSGVANVSTITTAMIELNDQLKNAGFNASQIQTILNLFGFSNISDKIKEIKDMIGDSSEEAENFINSLTSGDIEIVYDIMNQNGSITLDGLIAKLEDAKISAEDLGEAVDDAFTPPEDFNDFFDDIGKVTKKIDSITSAMEKLQKGTNLTTKELINMAEQYPELLRQANLFTDKSAEGRKRLLNVMLEASRKEYEDQINKKVAELNLNLEAVKRQIELEKSKQKLRMDIYTKYISGEIDLTTKGVKQVQYLQALASQDYARLKEGEVEVNRGALKKSNENTYGLLQTAVERIWSPYATDVGQLYIAMGRAGIQSTGEYVSATNQMLQALGWNMTQSIYNNITDPNVRSAIESAAISAYANLNDISVIDWMNNYNSIYNQNSVILRNFSGSLSDLTSGYSSVGDWYTQSSINSGKIIEDLEREADYIKNQINNLNGMKDSIDQDISDIEKIQNKSESESNNNTSDSTNNKKESNPLLDEFNAWYKLQKHLQEMGDPSFDIARFIAELEARVNSLKAKQAMTAEDAYKYEEEIAKAAKKFEDDAKDALDNVVKYRMKIIEEQRKKERDILNDRLEELRKFYDEQKNMLREQYEEEQYLKEQSEKRKAASDIQTQIDQLRSDNSAWALKKIEELKVKLRDANEDLDEFEREHALDETEKFLDDEYERQAKEIQDAIDKIDKTLNDPKAIYNIALAEIKSNSSDIYDEMREYGEKNGDGITNEAAELIKELADAIRDYENYQHDRMLIVNGKDTSYGGYDGMSPPKGYASGTKNAIPGLHLVNEFGDEAIFKSSNGNKYRMFSGGEKVLNARATDFLYAFADAGSKLSGSDMAGANTVRGIINPFSTGAIHMGDIIINGNADNATVSEIRRAQRESINILLKEFRKLKI